MTHENPIPEEDDDVYDLSVDEAGTENAEALMREALAAVDSAKRPVTAEDGGGDAVPGALRGGQESGAAAAADGAQLEVIRDLEKEVALQREKALRILADYENFRKRSERERSEQERFAGTELLREFLPVVDNLERALAARGSSDDVNRGVEMIHKQMQDLLRRFGVEPIAAVAGQEFDPMLHEAVTREEDPSVARPVVIEELQRGYSLHERLLRPSMVRVAMPPESPRDTDAQNVWSAEELSASGSHARPGRAREDDPVVLGEPGAIEVSASDPEAES
jgi:molecular chaperone GrpE